MNEIHIPAWVQRLPEKQQEYYREMWAEYIDDLIELRRKLNENLTVFYRTIFPEGTGEEDQ